MHSIELATTPDKVNNTSIRKRARITITILSKLKAPIRISKLIIKQGVDSMGSKEFLKIVSHNLKMT